MQIWKQRTRKDSADNGLARCFFKFKKTSLKNDTPDNRLQFRKQQHDNSVNDNGGWRPHDYPPLQDIGVVS